MKLPDGWQNAPLLIGAIVSLSLGVWLLTRNEHATLAAGSLMVIGSILIGALIADWARRRPGE